MMQKWEDLLVHEVMRKLYEMNKEKGHSVDDIFLRISSAESIPKKEFVRVLSGYKLDLTGSQITLVADVLDQDKNEEITKQEFMDRFRPAYHTIEEETKREEEWATIALHAMSVALRKKARKLDALFNRYDSDKDGMLSYEEFGKAIRKLGLGDQYSFEQRLRIAEYVDLDKNGLIDWKEFSSAFKEDDAWKKEAIQRICNVLHRNKYGLQRIFSLFDTDHSGTIDTEEFKIGLRALNQFLEEPLSDNQVEDLHKAIDTNHDGTVSYAEFVSAFKVIDTQDEGGEV